MKILARSCLAGAGLLAFATTLGWSPGRAQACGGFFCSQVPIDQSGEQIIFSVTQTKVIAHIQISFTGQAKDFAWVVPVQSKPTLSIGSQQAFLAIQQRTQPQYNVNWTVDGNCGFGGPTRGGLPGAQPPQASAGDEAVKVVDMREVGPYDTVTLESTDATALVKWLNANGFNQPPSAEPLIKHYVDLGMYFLALKLQQNAGTGEIQPIVVETDVNPEACIPLILTQVAAIPDLPVRAYFLSSHRTFPRNWFHVAINERRIDWLNGASNYNQVVTQAVNEAAGHGFVTEFAGKSDLLRNSVYQEGRWNLTDLRAITDPVAFLQQLLSMGFPRDQTMQALLRKHIPMPQAVKDRGVSEMMFYNNLRQYQADLAGFRFDPVAFVADLDERVITPLRKAQEMFDAQPYLTRLFSTVSANEMNRDPFFHENPDLPAVSNIHRAQGRAECGLDGTIKNITITLESGGPPIQIPGPIRQFGPPSPWQVGATEPFASRIELVGNNGAPTVYSVAQAKVADQYLDKEDPEAVRTRRIVGESPPVKAGSSNAFCSFGPGLAGASGLALALLPLLIVRRRRRR